jgi:DNA-binding transcriptional MerR regulator
VKTSEAAEVLSVSPTTLRAWEVRHGFPSPARTIGRHRVYERGEILALRRAIDEGLSVSSAIEKVRANLGIDDSQLESALRVFSAPAADLAMETALSVRRLDQSVQDVLLGALEVTRQRYGETSAAWAFAARWATDWLRRQTRLSPAPTRSVSLLLGDATRGELDPDRPAVAAFELFCSRAGAKVLMLPVGAISGLGEAAAGVSVAVVAGSGAGEEDVRRWLGSVRAVAGPVPLLFFRAAARSRGVVPSAPLEAQRKLFELLARTGARQHPDGHRPDRAHRADARAVAG